MTMKGLAKVTLSIKDFSTFLVIIGLKITLESSLKNQRTFNIVKAWFVTLQGRIFCYFWLHFLNIDCFWGQQPWRLNLNKLFRSLNYWYETNIALQIDIEGSLLVWWNWLLLLETYRILIQIEVELIKSNDSKELILIYVAH